MRLLLFKLFGKDRYKLIERTCKYDAYWQVFMWGKHTEPQVYEDTTWYAKEKMEGHRKYLAAHKFRYDFPNGFILNDGYYKNGSSHDKGL